MTTPYPTPHYHNRWVSVVACARCLQPLAVVRRSSDPVVVILDARLQVGVLRQAPMDRCGCGRQALATTADSAGWKHTGPTHVVLARYVTAWRWWAPWTWRSGGRWEISSGDLALLTSPALAQLVSGSTQREV